MEYQALLYTPQTVFVGVVYCLHVIHPYGCLSVMFGPCMEYLHYENMPIQVD